MFSIGTVSTLAGVVPGVDVAATVSPVGDVVRQLGEGLYDRAL